MQTSLFVNGRISFSSAILKCTQYTMVTNTKLFITAAGK